MSSIRVMFMLLVLVVIGDSFAFGARPQSPEGAKDLSSVFAPLDSNHSLYTVSDGYVAQAIYGSQKELIGIRVVPDYFFNEIHPQWKEPSTPRALTSVDYQRALRTVQEVKSLGGCIQGRAAYTTNGQAWFLDQCKKGVIRRSVRVGPTGPTQIVAFSVLFFQKVSGVVEAKRRLNMLGTDHEFRVKIKGQWYWTTQDEYRRVIEGHDATLEGAGPISGDI